MKNLIIEITGWYGTVAIVGAYFLVSFNLIGAENVIYQILNFTGAIGIVLISLYKKAYQPAVLNLIWTVIAIVALFKIILIL